MTTAEQARLLGDDRAPQNALAVGAAPESRPAPRGISPLSPSAPLPSGRDSIDDTCFRTSTLNLDKFDSGVSPVFLAGFPPGKRVLCSYVARMLAES